MPAQFNPGDRITIAGQEGEWILASWPASGAGNYTYYRDIDGVRTWGVGQTGVAEKGEPVVVQVAPSFVREGALTDAQELWEIADE